MANNLTLSSSPAAAFDTSAQKFGTAALSAGYGTTPTGLIPNTYPMTLECWFKATAGQAAASKVIMGADTFGGFGTNASSQLYGFYGASSTLLTTALNIFDGVWHHIAMVLDASGGRLYLDGNRVATSAVTYAKHGSYTSGQITVGTYKGFEASFQWPGEVDEAAVWSTGNYVGTTYTVPTSAYTGSESGLLALWHLDSNGNDAVVAPPTISAPTVTGLTAGGSSTISGTFANGAPTGLTYSLDSGGAVTASSPTITTTSGSGTTAAGTYSFTITTPAAGAHTITVTETGITTPATSTSTSFTTNSNVTILPGNAAIVYSPYTWSGGKTINPGAYFRTAFTGTAAPVLNFDVSAQTAPLPQVYVSIDGQPRQQFTLAATVTPTMPSTTAAWTKHTLEVTFKSANRAANRWSTQATAIVLTSVTLPAGQSVSAPAVQARNVLFLGDSLTEAALTVQSGSTPDSDDALLGWAYAQRHVLGAEVGVVGFSSQGLTAAGVGGVPVVGTAYSSLWSGQARSFALAPDLIVIAEGTNDSGASSGTFQTAMTTFLNSVLAATPNCPVAVLRPFNGTHAADIQAVIAAIGNSRLAYVDTTGMFNTANSSDGVHPYGSENITAIAPAIGAKLKTILDSAATPYRGGFKRIG